MHVNVTTATLVPSPVRYWQIADGPIVDADGRALIQNTSTHVLVTDLMESARIMARATGSVSARHIDTVHGVVIEAMWSRDRQAAALGADDEPEPDVEFSMDAVVDRLHAAGVPAYVEMTGGGCATIYAGGKHVSLDGAEECPRWDVAAGPGTYGTRNGNLALLAEFYVGPNDDGASGEADTLPDTITTADEAVRWAADTILRTVMTTETRSYAEWNQRPCRYCKETVIPGPNGTWETLGRTPCTASSDATHGTD